jgi:hypothetical protein
MPDSDKKPLVAVTGSQRPYVFDLPHLLAVPSGFEFRFRYRHKWVSESIQRELSEHSEAFRGRDLIVLFHSQETQRLIPLRKCTIVGLENLGPMIFLRFRVGPFASVDRSVLRSRDETATEKQGKLLSRLGESVLGAPADGAGSSSQPIDLAKPLPEGFYLREAASVTGDSAWAPSDTTEEQATGWACVASLLLHEPKLAGIPMFYVLGFQNKSGAFVAPDRISKGFSLFKEDIYGFELVEGHRYRLRVVEWCEPPQGLDAPGTEVNVDFRPEVLQLEGASNLVVGRYDTLEFTFRAGRPGYTELAITAEPARPSPPASAPNAPAPSPNWPTLLAARVPTSVRHNKWRLAAVLLIGLSGVYLFVYGPTLMLHPLGTALQLLGLLLASTALGEYLERFVKLGQALKEFRKDSSSGSSHAPN